MLTLLSAVIEDFQVVTTGIFESICENHQAIAFQYAGWQCPIFIGGLGKSNHSCSAPGGVEIDRAEGIADDVSNQNCLRFPFGCCCPSRLRTRCDCPCRSRNVLGA